MLRSAASSQVCVKCASKIPLAYILWLVYLFNIMLLSHSQWMCVCVVAELPEDCRGRWETFVEQTLKETNRKNTIDLVSTSHTSSHIHCCVHTHACRKKTYIHAGVDMRVCVVGWHSVPAAFLGG